MQRMARSPFATRTDYCGVDDVADDAAPWLGWTLTLSRKGQTMTTTTTIEDRIARLETSNHRLRLMLLGAAGVGLVAQTRLDPTGL